MVLLLLAFFSFFYVLVDLMVSPVRGLDCFTFRCSYVFASRDVVRFAFREVVGFVVRGIC